MNQNSGTAIAMDKPQVEPLLSQVRDSLCMVEGRITTLTDRVFQHQEAFMGYRCHSGTNASSDEKQPVIDNPMQEIEHRMQLLQQQLDTLESQLMFYREIL